MEECFELNRPTPNMIAGSTESAARDDMRALYKWFASTNSIVFRERKRQSALVPFIINQGHTGILISVYPYMVFELVL